jgi:superfamily II DNA or RNA helicase
MEDLKIEDIHAAKNKQQKIALNAWARNGFRGSVIAGTGFGKSRVGVLAIGHALKDGGNALLLVPTTQLQDQFLLQFEKWGVSTTNVEIMCYRSAYKLKDKEYTIVVCDEIHLGLSPEYRKFFVNNAYEKILCMTATLPEEPEYKVKLHMLAPTVYLLSLDDCVSLKIVAPYRIYCKPVSLTAEEAIEYKEVNNKFVYIKYKLGGIDVFNEAKRIMGSKFSIGEERAYAAQFYKCIRDRKRIVDFAENKISEFQTLIADNLDKKILVFSGANDFTDRLGASVDPLAVVYHSKKTKNQKQAALDSFREGDHNILCSTKALNQGFDVPNANMGVICGLTSKSLSMIQRVGRLIRFQEGKIGDIYILYVEDSQEEKWLRQSVKDLSNINWL